MWLRVYQVDVAVTDVIVPHLAHDLILTHKDQNSEYMTLLWFGASPLPDGFLHSTHAEILLVQAFEVGLHFCGVPTFWRARPVGLAADIGRFPSDGHPHQVVWGSPVQVESPQISMPLQILVCGICKMCTDASSDDIHGSVSACPPLEFLRLGVGRSVDETSREAIPRLGDLSGEFATFASSHTLCLGVCLDVCPSAPCLCHCVRGWTHASACSLRQLHA